MIAELEARIDAQEEELALLTTLFANAPAGIGFWDTELRSRRINDELASMRRLVDRAADEPVVGDRAVYEPVVDDRVVTDRPIEEFLPHPPAGGIEQLRRVLVTGEPLLDVEVGADSTGGRQHWLASFYPVRSAAGRILGLGAVVTDITERKLLEERLAHQATHDGLTRLPNRELFLDRLQVALARSRRRPGLLAVMLVDLDRFKVVNDTLGHAAGDGLLTAVAERLQRALRLSDTVAPRLGGDEFAVLCEGLASEREATSVADRILVALARPLVLGGREVVATASIGVATFSPGGSSGSRASGGGSSGGRTSGGGSSGGGSPDELLRNADAALYRAKEQGRSHFELFDDALRRRSAERFEIETSLHRALEREELRVAFQPIVGLSTGHTVAAETLVRWQHPERECCPHSSSSLWPRTTG